MHLIAAFKGLQAAAALRIRYGMAHYGLNKSGLRVMVRTIGRLPHGALVAAACCGGSNRFRVWVTHIRLYTQCIMAALMRLHAVAALQ